MAACIGTTVTTDVLGAWSITPTALADGAHTIVASQTDAFGNISTAALSFTLDTTVAAPTAPDLTAATDSGVVQHRQPHQQHHADRHRQRRGGRRHGDAVRHQRHHRAWHRDGGRLRQLVDHQLDAVGRAITR